MQNKEEILQPIQTESQQFLPRTLSKAKTQQRVDDNGYLVSTSTQLPISDLFKCHSGDCYEHTSVNLCTQS